MIQLENVGQIAQVRVSGQRKQLLGKKKLPHATKLMPGKAQGRAAVVLLFFPLMLHLRGGEVGKQQNSCFAVLLFHGGWPAVGSAQGSGAEVGKLSFDAIGWSGVHLVGSGKPRGVDLRRMEITKQVETMWCCLVANIFPKVCFIGKSSEYLDESETSKNQITEKLCRVLNLRYLLVN